MPPYVNRFAELFAYFEQHVRFLIEDIGFKDLVFCYSINSESKTSDIFVYENIARHYASSTVVHDDCIHPVKELFEKRIWFADMHDGYKIKLEAHSCFLSDYVTAIAVKRDKPLLHLKLDGIGYVSGLTNKSDCTLF